MNKMIFILLFTTHSFSAIPPMESLFRNGGYQELELNTAVVKLRIREISELNPTNESNLSQRELFNRYYKLILNKNQKGRFEFLQIEYTDSSMNNRSMTTFYKKNSFLKYLEIKKSINLEKDLFWGVMTSLVLGDSKAISSFLRKTNKGYRSNKKIINKGRKALYTSYKKYLKAVKDNPTLKANLSSPLAPRYPKQKDKILKLIKSPFYLPSLSTSLIKEGHQFYVLLKLEKTRAKFRNKDLKLLELNHHDLRGDIKLRFFDYKMIGRVNEIPENIIFSYFGKKYHIQMLSLKYTSYKSKTLAKIKKSLERALLPNKSKSAYVQRPRFLF